MNPLTAELIAIARHFGVFEREAVCCGTVTHAQCIVLQRLREGAQMNSGLASFTGASASAMTRLVDGLARRGWVERVRERADRRKVSIQLTPSGVAEADALLKITDEGTSAVLECIPADRRDAVVAALGELRVALEKAQIKGSRCC